LNPTTFSHIELRKVAIESTPSVTLARALFLAVMFVALLILPELVFAEEAQLNTDTQYSSEPPETPQPKKFTGENPLGVSRAEFGATQRGMDLIYQRKYPEALDHFEGMGMDFPDSPVGPIGRALVHQAAMFENYDFSRDRAYQTEVSEFRARLAPAQASSRAPEWIRFLNAVYLGVDAMYDIRKKRYVQAFDKAWEALEEIKRIRRGAPEFRDAELALGLYNYWRTVITESVKFLPPFGDRREEGLAQIRVAREEGLLAATPASFVLTFSLIEKGDLKAAIAEGERTHREYPDSLLNQLILAQAYRRAEKYDESLAVLKRLLTKHPEVERIWFQIAEAHYKSRKNNLAARKAYERYLESEPVNSYKAYTLYRLGQLESRARNYEAAISFYERALDLEPKFKRAKKRLEEAKKAIKRGVDSRKKKAKARTGKAG
jgi:tetratricopeptide (TPR) repeat protein